MIELSNYDKFFKGKAYELFTELTKASKERDLGIISVDDWDDLLRKKMSEMPRLEINEEDNDGEPLIIGIDFDRKLRVISKMGGSGVPRISPKAIKLMQEFLNAVYVVAK